VVPQEGTYTFSMFTSLKPTNLMLQGDDILEQDPVLLNWSRKIEAAKKASLKNYPFSIEIWSCGETIAPTRKIEGVTPSCKVEAELDISSLPEIQDKNTGTLYKKLIFDIEMKVIGTALEFTLIYDGQRIGQQNITVDFEDSKRSG
jgi:hypothetical protein